jgi:hypothetical protein
MVAGIGTIRRVEIVVHVFVVVAPPVLAAAVAPVVMPVLVAV